MTLHSHTGGSGCYFVMLASERQRQRQLHWRMPGRRWVRRESAVKLRGVLVQLVAPLEQVLQVVPAVLEGLGGGTHRRAAQLRADSTTSPSCELTICVLTIESRQLSA